ncbi:hypothetical protein [Armatimonas sp.]|uniref:hypothetical protein n=1 Tax=Armatimonas sp. TaxID=1872638 RepID=UPI0037530B3B
MERGRVVQSLERSLIVREKCPESYECLECSRDQSKPTRILSRGPLDEEEKEEVVIWMVQRIRSQARLPAGRLPTTWEMQRAAAVMMCLIVEVDVGSDEDGAGWISQEEIATALDLILITPTRSQRRYVRKIAHELAQHLMITEVAAEVFWAAEVRIEGNGWDNERERHKLALKVEELVMCAE